MNTLTIVNGADGDDTVIIDGRAIQFPIDALLPDKKIWAVQWAGDRGTVEYVDKPPKNINSINAFKPVIDEYWRRAALEDAPIELTIDEQKAVMIHEINAHARITIVGGFVSEALGALHAYASNLEDQVNLMALVLVGENNVLRCTDTDGVTEFKPHTLEQLRQVFSDSQAVKMNILKETHDKKIQVINAESAGTLANLTS